MRVRAAVVRIVDHGETTTVIGPRGALRFDGDSAGLLRAVLEIHGVPVTRAALLAELAERAGGEVPEAPIDELLQILEREGVIVAPRAPAARSFAAPRRVVLGISGAVAAVDAPVLVRGLHAMGCDVRIALTRTAQRFVSVAALQALTHHQVWRGLWQRDEATPVPHINLAEWAELVVVWPASATTLARLATGDCSDLVSAIVTATRAPVVVAASMNDGMYDSPAVQQNLETLRAHGRWLVHPTLGIEVAHRPEDRRPMFGPATPPSAMLEIVRHLLVEIVPRSRLPDGAAGWERLWSTTSLEQLPWHAEAVDPRSTPTPARASGCSISGPAPASSRSRRRAAATASPRATSPRPRSARPASVPASCRSCSCSTTSRRPGSTAATRSSPIAVCSTACRARAGRTTPPRSRRWSRRVGGCS
jgi:hypothetical protein